MQEELASFSRPLNGRTRTATFTDSTLDIAAEHWAQGARGLRKPSPALRRACEPCRFGSRLQGAVTFSMLQMPRSLYCAHRIVCALYQVEIRQVSLYQVEIRQVYL